MPRIAERNFFVLGPWVVDQDVLALEVNGFVVVEHSPDALRIQDLITLVIGLVHMF
jgi:hypothetical protein